MNFYRISILFCFLWCTNCLDYDAPLLPPRPEDGGTERDSEADEPTKPLERSPFRILNWNIQNYPLSTETTSLVTQVFDETKPDIIGVQEISNLYSFNQLLLSMKDFDAIYAYAPGNIMKVGLVIRTSRIRLVEHQTLFQDERYVFPRPALMADVEIINPGGEVEYELTLVVVHLKALTDYESWDRRKRSCVMLEHWVSNRRKESPQKDIIVLGDWNDELTDDEKDNVFWSFLQKPKDYFFLTHPLAETGVYSYLPFQRFLDHVLVTTDVLDDYGNGSTNILPLNETIIDYEKKVSDHLPVLIEFELP